MDNQWGQEAQPGGDAVPFDGSHAERVVPADGDPEVPYYRERLRGRSLPPRFHMYRLGQMEGRVRAPRRGMRWWLGAAGVIVLALLLLRPLAVLAAILIAALLALLIVGMLAGGALLLAVRFALGGRYPTDGAYAGRRAAWPWLAWRVMRRARPRSGWYV